MAAEGNDAFSDEKTEEDKEPEEEKESEDEKDFVDRLKKKRCSKVKRVQKAGTESSTISSPWGYRKSGMLG